MPGCFPPQGLAQLLLPSPPPYSSWPEFMENSQVNDSHLPFLLRRKGPNPPSLEPGTCLPQGLRAVGEQGWTWELNPEQNIPFGPHLVF